MSFCYHKIIKIKNEMKKRKNQKYHRRRGDMDQYLHYIGGPAGALALTGVAAASAYYLASRPTPEKPLVALDEQSYVIPGPELVRTSKFYKDAKEGKFLRYLYADTRTLYDSFRRGAKESTLLRAKNFGSGLVALGLEPSPKTFIGIYSQNCPEWVLTEQGAYCFSMVIVPLYDTLGPDACAYIIKQAEISVVVCEDDSKCNLLLDRPPKCLKRLITMKEVRPATNQRAKNRGIEIVKFEEIEHLGAAKQNKEVPPKVTDVCTICYTSGTTGNPKGVMLSHENVVAAVVAVIMQLGDHRINSKDIMISFLPLAHMLERCCEIGMYMVGGAVGFFSGDVKRLSDDMKVLKPTVTPAVPRLLNRIYDKVQSDIGNSFIKRTLFNMAMSSKENEIRRGIVRNNSFWDKLVFRKVQEGMGGRLRLMIVGSAPLAGNVLTFARCALGCLVRDTM
ncbi:UNVERIFIED_CONTAM: hypothetical protein B566_EDAN018387 [Ephemera danica]|nr:hypothetical protein B566_EDAN018387 [Ephemera danica]